VTLVVANKMDLLAARENLAAFQRARARDGLPVVAISADKLTGIDELIRELAQLLPDAHELGRPSESTGVVVHRFQSGPDASVSSARARRTASSAGASSASRHRRTSTMPSPRRVSSVISRASVSSANSSKRV